MSIYGIGIDIVEISRIEQSLASYGETFAKKILHPNEFDKWTQVKKKASFLAKRFAAKEAYAKAYGTGIVKGVTLPNIEVINNMHGKPEIKLHKDTLTAFQSEQLKKIHLSISDEKHYAVANVIIEK